MAQSFLVVLDCQIFDCLGETERSFSAGVTDSSIGSEALLEHPQQHWDVSVYVVVDPDFGLAGVMSVKSPAVLNQCAFPGDGHSEE